MKPKTSDGRFKSVYPPLVSGAVFGELAVVSVERRNLVRVQCSCKAPAHLVMDYNLRSGNTTR